MRRIEGQKVFLDTVSSRYTLTRPGGTLISYFRCGVEAMHAWLEYWSTAFQVLNVVAIIALTLVLVVVTYWQFRTANKAFLLEWKPELYAEAVFVASYPDAFEVTNMGRSTALLLSLKLLSPSRKQQESFESPCKHVIQPGKSEIVPVTRALRGYFEKTGSSHAPVHRGETGNQRMEISFLFYSGGTRRYSDFFEFLVDREWHILREG